jgi:5'-3' exonuclease
MGIPSFYKHLLQTVGGLTSRVRSKNPNIFALDLNCAIYHCVRKVSTVAPYTADAPIAWENRLIAEVVAYIKSMTRQVGPTTGLYIAVDGVVPMAKIKQQRYRRFKSGPAAAEELAVRAAASGTSTSTSTSNRWDTNAITPGTAFMERLGAALHAMQIPGCPRIIVSAADEPGEGEQKIMAWLRDQAATATTTTHDVVIYGLDADLIILAMLEHARSGRRVDLFREETEFGGGVKRDALGEEQYLYMDTAHLANVLHSQHAAPGASKQQFIFDFVGIMNLLGNDFVPHSMSLKINDQGIERALEAAKTLSGPLVKVGPTGGAEYNSDALATLLEILAAEEERWLLKGVRSKLDARVGSSSAAKDAEARALAALNDRPVQWGAEKVLAEAKVVEGAEKPVWFLRPAWRSLYYQHGLGGAAVADAVIAYRAALAWTLAYYFGAPVDPDWYFPWLLPPLFGDVAVALRAEPVAPKIPEATEGFLRPVEQLAMVLPATSFHLLPRELQDLPQAHPWAWPTAWSSYSMGRRFLWECEPQIPLIQPAQIRKWMRRCI